MIKVKVIVYMTLPKELGWKEKIVEFNKKEPTIENLFQVIKELSDIRRKYLERGWDLVILVNGRHIEFLDDEKTVLKDGDEVSIFPTAAGG